MKITNCHIHTFTIDHVPDKFIPVVGRFFRFGVIRVPFRFIMRYVLPCTDRDLLDRYARFIKITYRSSQKAVFKIIRGYYPRGTRFVVLPMDMAYMSAGKVKASLDEQHKELAQLAGKYPDQIIPFVAVDPRRPNILEKTQDLVENHGFRGIKLYPPLGYYPTDERLYPIYELAVKHGIPVMSHCTRGGVYDRRKVTNDMLVHPVTGSALKKLKPKEFTDYYTDPDNYEKVLKDFPDLRLCLAHFGGSKGWEDYLDQPWDEESPSENKSWLSKIMDMIQSGNYPNLYTDISYTILEDDSYHHLLKIFLGNERIRERVLFGSDFYMVEREKLEERRLSMKLRSIVGEDLFELIAHTNPLRYLGESES